MFILKPGSLSLKDILLLLTSDIKITLIQSAYSDISRSHGIVQDIVANNSTVYGINTGFGLLAHQKINNNQLKRAI